jgi:hypothetical protein
MGEFPEIDGVGAVEAPRRRVHARRGGRYLWPALAAIGAAALAFVLLADRCGTAAGVREVEELSADAHKFVELVRSGLPSEWSIEKVLEFPTLRPGSQAIMDLQHRRGQARVNLENKVDNALPEGERPDLGGMTEWISQPSWMPRARVEKLAHELHELDQALTRLRKARGLEPAPLALAGEPLPPMPERVALPSLPDGVDYGGIQVWPAPLAAVVLHWGHNTSSCRGNMQHCRYYQVVWVSWEGGIIGSASVAPPTETAARWLTSVGRDGTLFTGSVEPDGKMRLSAYAPDASEPTVVDVELSSQQVYFSPGRDGLQVGVLSADDSLYENFVVRAGLVFEPVEQQGPGMGFMHVGLDRRTGSTTPVHVGGAALAVQRNGGAVYATITPHEAKAPDAVVRLADFTAHDEEYLRKLVAGPTGVVLVFEASMSRIKLLLTQDGGRTWTGAPSQ